MQSPYLIPKRKKVVVLVVLENILINLCATYRDCTLHNVT